MSRVRWRHVTLNGQVCLTYLLSIRGIKVTTTVAYIKARSALNIGNKVFNNRHVTEILKNEITYQKWVVYVFRLCECDHDGLLTNLVL